MTSRPQRGRTMLIRYDLSEVGKRVLGVFLQLFDLSEVIAVNITEILQLRRNGDTPSVFYRF